MKIKIYPLLKLESGLPYGADAVKILFSEADQVQAFVAEVLKIQEEEGDISDYIDIVDCETAREYYDQYSAGNMDIELYMLDPQVIDVGTTAQKLGCSNPVMQDSYVHPHSMTGEDLPAGIIPLVQIDKIEGNLYYAGKRIMPRNQFRPATDLEVSNWLAYQSTMK